MTSSISKLIITQTKLYARKVNEVAEAIKSREKYFKKFKRCNLQIDYNLYIEAKYNTQKLIKQKKIDFFNTKIN